MRRTAIEWTDYSWNPVTGCTPISEGCENCYARRMAQRLRGRFGYSADAPFKVTLHPDRLEEPFRWHKPRKVFVCSMGDLFHEQVPDEYIAKVWEVMSNASQHTFIVLTKRPQRMKEFIERLGWYIHDREGNPTEAVLDKGGKYTLKNVWLGVTVENQEQADKRIPILLQIPAVVRFVSVEPMLGPVDIYKYLDIYDPPTLSNPDGYNPDKVLLDWVICGSETGPNRRPANIEWVRRLRDQCVSSGVPFFLKQMEIGNRVVKMPELDDQVWAQFPEVCHAS